MSFDATAFQRPIDKFDNRLVRRTEGFERIMVLDGMQGRPRRPFKRPKPGRSYGLHIPEHFAVVIRADDKQMFAWPMTAQGRHVELGNRAEAPIDVFAKANGIVK